MTSSTSSGVRQPLLSPTGTAPDQPDQQRPAPAPRRASASGRYGALPSRVATPFLRLSSIPSTFSALPPPPAPEWPPDRDDIETTTDEFRALYDYIKTRLTDNQTERERRAELYDKLIIIGEDYWGFFIPTGTPFEVLMDLRTTTRALPLLSSEPDSNVLDCARFRDTALWIHEGKQLEKRVLGSLINLVIAAKVDAIQTECRRTRTLSRFNEVIGLARHGWTDPELRRMRPILAPMFASRLELLRATILAECEKPKYIRVAEGLWYKVGDFVNRATGCS
ncbi:uncharacterized protein LOC62_06G008138 [Vanrija pseudolonga]|uniref:Uncharacterized protein n=1 Tax=Vanrija pseudolonga TaxID=143232 RepID=A0AAF0YGI9_9TREE|nr:hypothetical protein LOC62_06G008138 [Vanrija pseudolonga]